MRVAWRFYDASRSQHQSQVPVPVSVLDPVPTVDRVQKQVKTKEECRKRLLHCCLIFMAPPVEPEPEPEPEPEYELNHNHSQQMLRVIWAHTS